jgi:Peptidase family M50
MQNSFTPLIALMGTLILFSWSFSRAYQYGKLGVLSWSQQVILSLPWLVYFGAWLNHSSLSFAMLLLLLSFSTFGYGILGYQIRKLAISAQNSTSTSSSIVDDLQPIQEIGQIIEPQIDQSISVIPAKISGSDLQLIQGIFGIDTFYATETIIQQGGGVVFKGNLRGDPKDTHQRLTEALSDRLGNKFNLFLVEGENSRPLIYVQLYNPELEKIPQSQKILSVILLAVNVFTCAILSGELQGIDLIAQPNRWISTLPFVLGVTSILAARELSQRWIAKKYEVLLTPPFCLPSSQIGTFGAFSRIKTALPNRKALFDLAIAPAIASGVISLAFLIVGLFLSKGSTVGLEVPSQIFQYSVFVGILAKLILGNSLSLDLLSIDPLVVLGWLGLTITALNLLPAGQLDGGRIVQAVFGRKTASLTTLITLLLLALASLINPISLYWAGIILILLRDQERPMLNEISELDSDRDIIGIAALFWMILVILPMTPMAAEKLGIG